MPVTFNLGEALDSLLKAAATSAGLEAAAFVPDVRIADPRHGDFQANGVLGYAKARRLNPRAVAEQLVAALPAEVAADYTVAIAGPGFINFTLKPATLLAWLRAHDSAAHLRANAATARHGQTWVVDYSSPNTAKQMHVGHLRSAVIGEAICRLLEFSGAKVIRDNHVGDWGTQFGKLIWAYRRHLDAAAFAADPLEEFERLYKVGNEAADADPAVMEQARAELVKLQNGDPENLAIWRQINGDSLAAFQVIYDQLGIKFDVMLGESFYTTRSSASTANSRTAGSPRKARARSWSFTRSTRASRPSRSSCGRLMARAITPPPTWRPPSTGSNISRPMASSSSPTTARPTTSSSSS